MLHACRPRWPRLGHAAAGSWSATDEQVWQIELSHFGQVPSPGWEDSRSETTAISVTHQAFASPVGCAHRHRARRTPGPILCRVRVIIRQIIEVEGKRFALVEENEL